MNQAPNTLSTNGNSQPSKSVLSKVRSFFEVLRNTPEAFRLVMKAGRTNAYISFGLTPIAALMPAAQAYVGKLIVDSILSVVNTDVEPRAALAEFGGRVAYIRMEATTNLIGGQPFSLQNLRDVSAIARSEGIPLVFDGSLISENAYFIQQREAEFAGSSIAEIILEMMRHVDIFYMSGRKSAAARGGLIATNRKDLFDQILPWLPVFEGFATYGGMSIKEVEAMAVGLREMLAPGVASSSADFIAYFVQCLIEEGVPVVTPAGICRA